MRHTDMRGLGIYYRRINWGGGRLASLVRALVLVVRNGLREGRCSLDGIRG